MNFCQHVLIMNVFNEKTQNPRSTPQETQQKTFKFVKSPKGEINLGPLLGIPAASLDRQHKCILQCRYPTNFP